jgi:hypothetical protein
MTLEAMKYMTIGFGIGVLLMALFCIYLIRDFTKLPPQKEDKDDKSDVS